MDDINDKKKRQIIVTAKDLFWKYGIKRVTIEEICRKAKVSKMTFYKHFSNKTELVKFIIDRIVNKGIEDYNHIMNKDIPFIEKVKQTLQKKLEGAEAMSQEFFDDFYRHADPELIDFMNEKQQMSFRMVINDYAKAQKLGYIRQDIKMEFIMYYLGQIHLMLKDEALTAMYSSPQELIMELTKFFFYGILPAERT